MTSSYRIACLLAVGAILFLGVGCSTKGGKSSGDTSRSSPSTTLSEPSGGTERLSPDGLYAKTDPSTANRQLAELRAEQSATAAAGLQDVFFGYDSWTISEGGQQVLKRNAEWLRAHGMTKLKVEGHCDERGTSAYNLVPGEKRAKSVRNYLMDLGVKGDHLTVVTYGKERPVCYDPSESCYQQNRRGHLVVQP
ncbi:MAG: OmpA family protein [Nitrospiraceae bacterium]